MRKLYVARKLVFISTSLIFIFFNISSAFCTCQQKDLILEKIFEDPKLEGSRPSSGTFSPDGKIITYVWKDSERDSTEGLWAVSNKGGKPEKLIKNIRGSYFWLPDTEKKQIVFRDKNKIFMYNFDKGVKEKISKDIEANSFPVLSPCGKYIAFTSKEGLWKIEIETQKVTQLTVQRGSSLRWSPDGKKVSYLYKSNLWIVYINSKENIKLTEEEESNRPVSRSFRYFRTGIRDYYWSPDGNYIIFVKRKNDNPGRDIFVADYLSKYVKKIPARNSFPDSRSSIVSVGLITLKNPKVQWLDLGEEKHFNLRRVLWSPDSKKIALVKITEDQHYRYILVIDAKTGTASILDHEYDEAWIGGPHFSLFWNKDAEDLIFTSERNGYNHLYSINIQEGTLKQLTEGKWEISSVIMHPDTQQLLYSSTQLSTTERHFYLISTKGGWAKKLPTVQGYNSSARFSNDGNLILYSHSDLAKPDDYYVLNTGSQSAPARITDTVPPRFKNINWTIPEFVTFRSTKDGELIHARIFKPKNLDVYKKYPCAIFVHGAGYLQNITRSWTPYSENFKFHHMLVQKGYVIFDIDYRGSKGYGRKFRTDVYLDMGGIDLEDELDGVRYLETLGYIDMEKIGLYGGSYGGFMTLMALFKAPDTFACGAALRSVTDWANYNAGYTQARLGLLPENKKIYEKCSPIYFAENLKKPLLLMHGLVDANVFCQDSFQLAEKLIELGIDFELMIYPSQGHGFHDPQSWIDEYGRIEKLFDRYLK